MKGVVDERAISISAIVNARMCALPVSSAEAEKSTPLSTGNRIIAASATEQSRVEASK
jgi:hypothetical protein